MSDQRTSAAKRDLALLHVLGTAGLRRAEACAPLIADITRRRRAADGRLRRAIPYSTSWWVTIGYGKRGRHRAVPVGHDVLHAIAAWIEARPVIPAHSYRLLRISPGSLRWRAMVSVGRTDGDRRSGELILRVRGAKRAHDLFSGIGKVDRLARSGVSAGAGLCSTQGAAWLAWAMVVPRRSGRRSRLWRSHGRRERCPH